MYKMYEIFHILCLILIFYTHSFWLSISYIIILIIYSELLLERVLDFSEYFNKINYLKCVIYSVISISVIHFLFYIFSNNFNNKKIIITKNSKF